MPDRHQLIVVANRLPVRNVSDRDGQRWVTSPGGLVSALAPFMTTRPNATWVGWSGAAGRAPDPFVHDDIELHPIELTRADVQLYYEGFSNGTLWPLYHDAIAEPEYHRTWWDAYVKVNRRFADSVIETFVNTNGHQKIQVKKIYASDPPRVKMDYELLVRAACDLLRQQRRNFWRCPAARK